MVEALLCDIDGTLVESNWLHAQAWQVAFAEMGIDLELEDVRRQIGKGGDELIPVFVPWWKRKHVEESLKAYRSFVFRQDYLPQVRPFPLVREFVQRVQAADIRFALATSANRQEIDDYRKIANIDDLVEEQTSADDASKAKPHPDIFSATVHRLKLQAKHCIALGDTPYDAEAAGLAGVRTIGLTTGGWSKQELMDAGCVEVYDGIADLLEHFEESALVRSGLRL
ncbi:HAD family hydrolase [Granulicella cerasi]|uniref:HAD family hydrolase n=1 Tax=Granulicella cerasi TaxID=741063 RepID=A0ABW1Z7E0_9BACT|nr:HAD family hydrolase [Granulicella cerasi]